MAISYTWSISQLDSYPEADGYTDVVFNVHWHVEASEDGYSASAYGTQAVGYEADRPFVAYADLTEELIVAWTKTSMGEYLIRLESSLAQQIADQKNPPVVVLPLPW